MAHRLYDILSTKASLGMGMDHDMHGYGDIYGHGRRKKTTKRSSINNHWVQFVKDYLFNYNYDLPPNKQMTYRDALKSEEVCNAYRKELGRSRTQMPCIRKYSSKSKAPKKRSSSKRRTIKKAPAKRASSKRAPIKRASKKTCPKSKKLKRVNSYKRRSGKTINPYYKCVNK